MTDRQRRIDLDQDRSAALRSRLLQRAGKSRETAERFTLVRFGDGTWRYITPGTRAKRFDETGSRSALVQMEAGSTLPMHHHKEHEECFVLRGEVQMGNLKVRAGDYHIAPTGSRHAAVRSPTGALLLLRGAPIASLATMARSMLSAWLPRSAAAEPPSTVRADEGAWSPGVLGVEVKHFGGSNNGESALLRLRAEAAMPLQALSASAEFLLVEGEAFFGETLLRPGDYWFAPVGSPELTVSSDIGAMLYRHSGAAGA